MSCGIIELTGQYDTDQNCLQGKTQTIKAEEHTERQRRTVTPPEETLHARHRHVQQHLLVHR